MRTRRRSTSGDRRWPGHSASPTSIAYSRSASPGREAPKTTSTAGVPFPLAQLRSTFPGAGSSSAQLAKEQMGSTQMATRPDQFPLAVLDRKLDERRDFLDTAALMSLVDLVVTPETAVAHLAGGLGVRTWVAISKSATGAGWSAATPAHGIPASGSSVRPLTAIGRASFARSKTARPGAQDQAITDRSPRRRSVAKRGAGW